MSCKREINMAKETAEQKLLRLIEQGADGAGAPQQCESPEVSQVLNAVRHVGGSAAFPPVFVDSCAAVKQFLFNFLSIRDGFSIREVNKLLVVVVMVAAVFFISSITGGMREAGRIVSFDHSESVPFSVKTLLPVISKLEKYVSAVSFRNIFHPFEKKAVVSEEAGTVQAPAQIVEKTKNLKLVGISWLDTPESASAMIEGTDSGITYFLRSGEKVNGLTVKMIYADSVVLELNGQQMELKL